MVLFNECLLMAPVEFVTELGLGLGITICQLGLHVESRSIFLNGNQAFPRQRDYRTD